MSISYALGSNPLWYFADKSGRPATGALMYTYRSLNKIQHKPVYQDAGGTVAWEQPIPFKGNGSQGPFYWEFDTDNPDETYYIEIYAIVNGQPDLLFTLDNFTGNNTGGGGGSNVTTYVSLQNYVVNNVFFRNQGTISGAGLDEYLVPSAHSAFARPHMQFHKDSASNTDNLSFPEVPHGTEIFTGDVTTHYIFNAVCLTSNPGETYKYVEIPISPKVGNFDNQTVTFTIWAIDNGIGSPSLDIELLNFYGSQGGSPDDSTTQTINLTTSWAKYPLTFIVPNSSGKSIGACGDDGFYLRINFPLNTAYDISLGKPSLYLGILSPSQEFVTYDEVDRIISSPQTADIRISTNFLNYNFPAGWLPMNDGSIGSSSSGATTRANTDSFFLYKTIWNGVEDSFAPVTGGRGASAEADFASNKPIFLTRMLGRVLAGTSNPEDVQTFIFTVDVPTDVLTFPSTNIFRNGMPISFSTTGTLPAPLSADTIYWVISLTSTTMKVAKTYIDSLFLIPIDIADAGTGVHSIVFGGLSRGQVTGEYLRQIDLDQMPQHNHPASLSTVEVDKSLGATQIVATPYIGSSELPLTTQPALPAEYLEMAQPTVYQNIYIKL